jgi:hypothetical protein
MNFQMKRFKQWKPFWKNIFFFVSPGNVFRFAILCKVRKTCFLVQKVLTEIDWNDDKALFFFVTVSTFFRCGLKLGDCFVYKSGAHIENVSQWFWPLCHIVGTDPLICRRSTYNYRFPKSLRRSSDHEAGTRLNWTGNFPILLKWSLGQNWQLNILALQALGAGGTNYWIEGRCITKISTLLIVLML